MGIDLGSILQSARLSFAVLFISLVAGLGFYPAQSDFASIAALYLPLFILYVCIAQHTSNQAQLIFWLGVGVLSRFILLFAFPNLSDDIYRFVWDGRLVVQDINPFEQLPSYYLTVDPQLPGINQALYDQLNSPNYFTIYPPICQTIFAGAVSLAGENIDRSALVMKVFLLACELGSFIVIFRILALLSLPNKNVLWYALNPLVIIEVMGNLHFEGAMVFFFLLSFYFLIRSKIGAAAFVMGLSIGSKLLPLMFLPTLLKRLGFKKTFIFSLLTGITVLVLFLPLLSETFLANFGNSLDLYFRRFEFNASIYYLVREIWQWLEGYNPISIVGPFFPIATISYILYETFLRKEQSIENWLTTTLLVFTCYLCFATTIHPWYLCLPIVMCLFTPYRYPILWSGLIMMTYINYNGEVYYENLWIVLLEYLAVFAYMVYEFRIYTPWKKNFTSDPVSANIG